MCNERFLGWSHPFRLKNPFCGVGHGLTITDTLDRLYLLTGDVKYREYALWLYKEYSAGWQAESDLPAGAGFFLGRGSAMMETLACAAR